MNRRRQVLLDVTARGRLLLALCRPAVLALFGLFAVTAMAQAGVTDRPVTLTIALLSIVGYLVFSVVLNDLADEAIDRINLPADPGRPLVAGSADRRRMGQIAAAGAVVAVGSAAVLSWLSALVVLSGLALSAAYSLRPIRIAERGAVASLLLPLGYVAVPFLVGILAVRSRVTGADLTLLGGLYVGFIGRILLKDFRDVRGDALFGKRTFLVRHGRRATCSFSAVCWVAGSTVVAAIRGATLDLAVAYALFTLLALALLRALSVEAGARRDEALVGAVALVGRGTIVTVIGHLSVTDAGWNGLRYHLVMAAFAAVTVGQAVSMARRGPITRLTVATCEGAAPPTPDADLGAYQLGGTTADAGGRHLVRSSAIVAGRGSMTTMASIEPVTGSVPSAPSPVGASRSAARS